MAGHKRDENFKGHTVVQPVVTYASERGSRMEETSSRVRSVERYRRAGPPSNPMELLESSGSIKGKTSHDDTRLKRYPENIERRV